MSKAFVPEKSLLKFPRRDKMCDLTLVQCTEEGRMPLGPPYLAHGLNKAGIPFNLKIGIQYAKGGLFWDMSRLFSFLENSKNILAISCWSNALPILLVVLEKIKKKFPQKTIILGGIGPTEVAEEIMRQFGFIDFVIRGCGVLPLPLLVRKILKQEKIFNDISGLVHRNGPRIISNEHDSFYSRTTIPDGLSYEQIDDISSYYMCVAPVRRPDGNA